MEEMIRILESDMTPRREMDFQIRRVLAGEPIRVKTWWLAWDRVLWEDGRETEEGSTPHYTESIDDALTLVPEEAANCYGFDWSPRGDDAFVSRNNVSSGHWLVEGRHPTSPAIALCIASLKARCLHSSTKGETSK